VTSAIIPPTEEAVEKVLTGTDRDPADVVELFHLLWSEATVEKIAINATMAGCLPEYMPVMIAAVGAMCGATIFAGFSYPSHPVSFC